MADITMCSAVCCPLALSCYRKQALPGQQWQSWAAFEYKSANQQTTCEHYVPMVIRKGVEDEQRERETGKD